MQTSITIEFSSGQWHVLVDGITYYSSREQNAAQAYAEVLREELKK